ncbi:PH domain-containing protein [Clavibacter zhangzhiyongii]|uniref:PH domain-containing protein n=1 Tax=Clavibacter zhangzhiyongii TaxID=2768071 RepID=UPI0039E083D8
MTATPEGPAAGEPGAAATAVPAAEARIAEELTDGGWHRLHPATPLLRGGVVFLIAIGFLVSSLREQIVERFVPGQDESRGEGDLIPWLVESGGLIWAVLGLLAFTLLAVGVSYLSWRMHTFRVTEETVEVRSGILSRTNRRARLDRIQGVNITRPPRRAAHRRGQARDPGGRQRRQPAAALPPLPRRRRVPAPRAAARVGRTGRGGRIRPRGRPRRSRERAAGSSAPASTTSSPPSSTRTPPHRSRSCASPSRG